MVTNNARRWPITKLSGPLFSLGARGSIAPGLTYSSHRGMSIVETKPIPSQPNTLPQQVVKQRFQDALAAWNNSGLTQADKRAWAARGQLQIGNAAGQAKHASTYYRVVKAGQPWQPISNLHVIDLTQTSITVQADYAADGPPAHVWWFSRTFPTTAATQLVHVVGTVWLSILDGLRPSSTYEFFIRRDTHPKIQVTGTYSARTLPQS